MPLIGPVLLVGEIEAELPALRINQLERQVAYVHRLLATAVLVRRVLSSNLRADNSIVS
jgi:hypothetical protein